MPAYQSFAVQPLKLEEELDTTPERINIAVGVNALAVEVLSQSNYVLERRVVHADFPALSADLLSIFRAEDGRVGAEVTTSRVSAPRTLVGSLAPL